MKKLLASALALVGISAGAQAQPTLQTVDPKSITFTTPTVSNDIAELEPISSQPSKEDFVLHEYECAQVEFLRAEQLPAIKKALREFKSFEAAHRTKDGWTEVFVRSLPRETLAFAKLNASDRLVLVDWRQQLVLIAMTQDGQVDAWRP